MSHRFGSTILLLVAAFILSLNASAQLVFLPDQQVRDQIEAWAPGTVDGNGYYNASDPAIQQVTDLVFSDFSALDLTGTEQLPALRLLVVMGADQAASLTVNGFAPTLGHIGVSTCSITALPALPDGLRSIDLYKLDQLLVLPALPQTVTMLFLTELPNISDLNGLLPDALGHFHIDGLPVTELPVLPSTLDTLRAWNLDVLTALPVPLPDLHWMELQHLPLVNIVPELGEALVEARFWDLPITDLPPMGTSVDILELIELDQLSSIGAFPNVSTNLQISNCPVLTTFPAPPGTGPHRLEVINSHAVETLPQLPEGIVELYLTNADSLEAIPNFPTSLELVWVQNSTKFQHFPPLNTELEILWATVCPMLTELPNLPDSLLTLSLVNSGTACLPALPSRLTLINASGSALTCLPNVPASLTDVTPASLLSSICNVTTSPCPDGYPEATGKVFLDENGNGLLDPAEPGLANCTLLDMPYGFLTDTDENGNYSLQVPLGDHTISCSPNSPYVSSVQPASHEAILHEPNHIDSLNHFAVVLVPDMADLRVTMSATPARPGFHNTAWVVVENPGTVVQDATLTVVIDTTQEFHASIPEPSTISGDTITWFLGALPILSAQIVELDLGTPIPTPLGTPLIHHAGVLPVVGDLTPTDNLFAWNDTVVGSYDPNDKVVTPAAITPQEATQGARLTYTIRFQNTGTYHAERVLLTDELSPALDISSFQFVGASHAHTWTLENGRLEVLFNNIMLPYEDQDEAGSHGFFSFAISTLPGFAGTEILNRAFIYFDFNPPIITPWSSLRVEDVETGVPMEPSSSFTVIPNPADEEVHVANRNGDPILAIRLFATDGRSIPVRPVLSGTNGIIPLAELSPGSYFMDVRTASSSTLLRFMKR
ncbi:MAG TPA: hypothetical protein PLB89_01380 [Flavobacteriales bacterium]|nr:hypothetical protein [Flavobacteriales bacterium]